MLETPGAIGGSIFIQDNPSECSSESEILAADCILPVRHLAYSESVSITPNPTRGMIYVSAAGRPVTEFRIYNNLGECLRTLSGARVDVSDLPPGLYWVRVRIGEEIGLAKLVKM